MSYFRDLIFQDIINERDRQDAKWGSQRKLPMDRWNTILGEEVGEVAHAVNEGDLTNLAEELIQVAAVAVCWLESLYDGKD